MGKKQQGRTRYDVTAEQFVQAWQSCDSADAVAALLKMPKAIVLARASGYRAQGVKLKKMKRQGKNKLDVAGLNALIEQLDRDKRPS
jgi:hypothetical protein